MGDRAGSVVYWGGLCCRLQRGGELESASMGAMVARPHGCSQGGVCIEDPAGFAVYYGV